MHLWQRALTRASLLPKPLFCGMHISSLHLLCHGPCCAWGATQNTAHKVPGDISQPDCGIQHEAQERLLPEVDFVLHAAASIQFTNHVHEDLRLSYLATESILKLSQRVSGVSRVCSLTQPRSVPLTSM